MTSKFAVIIEDGTSNLRVALLDSETKSFGRFLPPFNEVPLRNLEMGTKVAKKHFEIRWNDARECHEIRDWEPTYATAVNGIPLGEEARSLVPGDVIRICIFTLHYVIVE